MDELRPRELGETPALEVIVYRDDEVVERVRCDSELEAAEVVAAWVEVVGVRCVVTGFSEPSGEGAASEVEPLDDVELYPVDVGDDRGLDVANR
jgi:hypothetical protein